MADGKQLRGSEVLVLGYLLDCQLESLGEAWFAP
jgi:hypothetical protein